MGLIVARRRLIFALLLVLGEACSTHTRAPAPPPASDVGLRTELLRRMSADQAVRERFVAAVREGKQPDSALVAHLHEVDAENTLWLAEMVAHRGWPGRSMVGADGADAAFLFAQHADADTAFQARVLSLLARAYQSGEATGQQLALLTDRVATARGNPQVYGTQVDLIAGRAVLKPLLDSAHVDARRATVGLPPLWVYLRVIDSVYTPRGPGAPDSASQASCARDLAALRRPAEVDAIRHAVVEARSCPGGADALVAVWDAPPSDDVALRQLGVMSGDYRDQRMLDALLRAASASRPRAIRLAAFRGLARYCLQHATLLYRDLSTPGLAPQHYVWVTLESREGPVSVIGSSPLAASACQTVRSTLGSIGRNDPDTIVRAIAGHLVTRLDELGKVSAN